ncbi:MAG TPA: ABC transporter permease [Intrasporangium sp.]|uniref:ABC transporter permease n=1 Tax=Intrasporangium sp. TaxID=1925024 RepID=UPI002D7904E2|nr:ABC transporter permease [Intrasporangium sp.]HET7398163.1 ABC transporter permease [Intrasporangium sp.]
MNPTLAIAAVELRRFLRDRANIFFVFLLPILLVLIIGAQFGGAGPAARVALVGEPSALRTAVATRLEQDGVEVTSSDRATAREQVARGRSDVALLVEPGAAGAFAAGQDAQLQIVSSSGTNAMATTQRVRGAVEKVRAERGQLAALETRGVDRATARTALQAARAAVVAPGLRVVDIDSIAQAFVGLGQFDLGASSQLLLFVFLSSLTGSTALIQARRQGVTARTLAAPVATRQALGGQVLGRFTIAFVQGAYIMAASSLLFDVDWGTLWLALLVLVVFALVAAGAAMLVGSVMDNEGAASGLGVGAGLVLGALGGAMVPLELFPDDLRTVAHFTPHWWATDAFAQIQRHDGTLLDILPSVGVLLGMAAVLLTAGTWALRRSLARAM